MGKEGQRGRRRKSQRRRDRSPTAPFSLVQKVVGTWIVEERQREGDLEKRWRRSLGQALSPFSLSCALLEQPPTQQRLTRQRPPLSTRPRRRPRVLATE